MKGDQPGQQQRETLVPADLKSRRRAGDSTEKAVFQL